MAAHELGKHLAHLFPSLVRSQLFEGGAVQLVNFTTQLMKKVGIGVAEACATVEDKETIFGLLRAKAKPFGRPVFQRWF